MFTHLCRALALVVATTGLVGLAQLPAAAFDQDCGDFATQSAAQTFFVGAGAGDPHRLDADGDGQACETLPCPCGVQQGQPQPFAGSTTSDDTDVVRRSAGNVVEVVDGDTLEVRVDGVGIRSVRLIGIDTPEKHGRAECGGRKASRRMRGLAPVGSRVVLLSDPSQADRDRYGRLLRYVERRGKDVGRAQVNLGQARVYVFDHVPFRRTADYRRAERGAREMSRGLWSSCWA